MTSGKEGSSRKDQIREKRRREKRQQRFIFVLGIALVVIIIGVVVLVPIIRDNLTPVGSILSITPVPRPKAQGMAMGDSTAPVKIDVWEDFQCPSCLEFTDTVEPQIMTNLIATGKIYYVFHNYPFIDDRVNGTESHQAANAAMCAADQSRFWDYHDMLFKNQDPNGENLGAFVNKRLVAFAQALGLDMNKFNQCFNANTFKAKIDQDKADGDKAGVNGTPSVFVNGKIVNPGYIPSYTDIVNAVNAASVSGTTK